MSKIRKITKNKLLMKYWNILSGIFIAAFAFSIFITPNDLVAGGVGGIVIIIGHFIDINISLILLFCNIILLLVAFFLMDRKYFTNAILGTILYPIMAYLLEILKISELFRVDDIFLSVIIGAVLMGLGLGLVLKENSTTGGVDVIQSILFKYFHLPFSKTLYIIDIAVIISGTMVFGFTKGLYGLVFVLVCGQVLDMVVFGGFNKRATYIISKKEIEIKEKIFSVLGRGVSEIYIKGGYSEVDKKIILCVLSTREYFILRNIVEKIDPQAFLFVTKATEVRGLGFSYDDDFLEKFKEV